MTLAYGGDDITSSLASILRASNFPYRDLDLAKSQEWLMMDNLKIKICTLEEVSSMKHDYLFSADRLATGGEYNVGLLRIEDGRSYPEICLQDI